MVKVRTRFQPRHELEVPQQEADVLKAQGLLWEGDEEALHALLAADPIGPLDPQQRFDAPPEKAPAAKPATATAAENAKGAA
jgi:hypothetical protein